jgi:hypothetical protein
MSIENPTLAHFRHFSSLITNEIRSTKDYVRKNNLFMQNKANFRKVKFNVNKVLTKAYDRMDTWSIRKTKPIQTQFKAKTNPIKANSNPIQTQTKPNKPKLRNDKNLHENRRGRSPGHFFRIVGMKLEILSFRVRFDILLEKCPRGVAELRYKTLYGKCQMITRGLYSG